MTNIEQKCVNALRAYSHIGKAISCEPYGNGHINETYLVVTEHKRYILQKINRHVFPRPDRVMENICGVTEHIRKKAKTSGGDVERATLTVVQTDLGSSFYLDTEGDYWRVYDFVERTVTRERVSCLSEFFACGEAFGRFQGLLSDYDANRLHEPIAHFHDTPIRYARLMSAFEKDACSRANETAAEIAFVRDRIKLVSRLSNAHAKGALPLRVTHNDTKLNNILFDEKSGMPVCVIDLDTVMPGFSVNDFGDSIRFGANTADEDERDLSKVSLDMELYNTYYNGFVNGCDGRLKESEIELLPIGAMTMTLECGMRFLTDYLEGDVYFRVHREGHNLDRARNQFALLADMERKII